MEEFENLLRSEQRSVERYVNFRVGDPHDADDVLQETYIAAYNGFAKLKDKSAFKAWLIGIARYKCDDYFRARSKSLEIPTDKLIDTSFASGVRGRTVSSVVRDTISKLGDKDKQILFMYFFLQMPQAEIAKKLSVPIGTVKSRLYTAKQNFKRTYPYRLTERGENKMNRNTMPDVIPEYTITKSEKPPFDIRWEEMMGWFIVPKVGERLTWAAYDFPERKRTETCEMEVVGKAEVHGIKGVEITAKESDPMAPNKISAERAAERRFIAQLTDTHCRYLAETHVEGGVKKLYTFLDGDDFLPNWGYGDDNCGKEVNISQRSLIKYENNTIISDSADPLLDIVGRFTVYINGKDYDTDLVVDLGSYEEGVVSLQYIDENGKTVLWRRFNRDDWGCGRYKMNWSEMHPDNEFLVVNGETYVHWYDCITDYIL